jgi:flagellar protein FlgJ
MTAINNQLPSVQPHLQEDNPRNPQVMKAAQMYENQFLREMVKAMRQTVPENEVLPPSMAEKIFQNQLDEQYVDNWVDRGGVGFADVIYQQIMERFMTPPGAKPQGPLKPQDPEATSQPIKTQDKDLTIKVKTSSVKPSYLEVLSPWSGKILMSSSPEPGLQTVMIDHGGGLNSSLVYKGWIGTREGAEVQAGQKLGGLSIENREVFWRIHDKS